MPQFNLTMAMQWTSPLFLVNQKCLGDDQSSESIEDKSKNSCLKGGKGAKEIVSVKLGKNTCQPTNFPML